jgi:hypothetical protein
VSATGFVVVIDDREIAVRYRDFPFFRDASEADLRSITRPASEHLRWPRLDIDLELDSLEHPSRYPLTERRLRRVSETPRAPSKR